MVHAWPYKYVYFQASDACQSIAGNILGSPQHHRSVPDDLRMMVLNSITFSDPCINQGPSWPRTTSGSSSSPKYLSGDPPQNNTLYYKILILSSGFTFCCL